MASRRLIVARCPDLFGKAVGAVFVSLFCPLCRYDHCPDLRAANYAALATIRSHPPPEAWSVQLQFLPAPSTARRCCPANNPQIWRCIVAPAFGLPRLPMLLSAHIGHGLGLLQILRIAEHRIREAAFEEVAGTYLGNCRIWPGRQRVVMDTCFAGAGRGLETNCENSPVFPCHAR